MNAAVATEVLLRRQAGAQADLPLATPEVQRWVWESRYGAMLIEVVRGQVFVNGQVVEPHIPDTVQRTWGNSWPVLAAG